MSRADSEVFSAPEVESDCPYTSLANTEPIVNKQWLSPPPIKPANLKPVRLVRRLSLPCEAIVNDALLSRYQLLIVSSLSLISMAGHFWLHCLAIFQLYLNLPPFNFSASAYGMILSSLVVPHGAAGLLGGALLSTTFSNLLLLLFGQVAGMSVFILGIHKNLFYLAIAGNVLTGMSFGALVVLQRALVSKQFVPNMPLNLSYSLTIATACIAKATGSASVVPSMALFQSPIPTLLFLGGGISTLSVVGVIGFSFWSRKMASRVTELDRLGGVGGLPACCSDMALGTAIGDALKSRCHYHLKCTDAGCEADTCGGTPRPTTTRSRWADLFQYKGYIFVVLLHATLLTSLHAFNNFIGLNLKREYAASFSYAGKFVSTMSLISAIIAPISAYMLDKWGGGVYACAASTAVCIAALATLCVNNSLAIVTAVGLVVPVCEAVIAVILMTWTPLGVPKTQVGLAFGLVEVLYGFATVGINGAYGYLMDVSPRQHGLPLLLLLVLLLVSLGLLSFICTPLFNTAPTKVVPCYSETCLEEGLSSTVSKSSSLSTSAPASRLSSQTPPSCTDCSKCRHCPCGQFPAC
eukprot:Platyproteum_vivax@DN3825_c0_g1_i1.p1